MPLLGLKLSREVRGGVTVNICEPGVVDTKLLRFNCRIPSKNPNNFQTRPISWWPGERWRYFFDQARHGSGTRQDQWCLLQQHGKRMTTFIDFWKSENVSASSRAVERFHWSSKAGPNLANVGRNSRKTWSEVLKKIFQVKIVVAIFSITDISCFVVAKNTASRSGHDQFYADNAKTDEIACDLLDQPTV